MESPSPTDRRQGWSKEQREFCVKQYYLNCGRPVAVRRLYIEKFNLNNLSIAEHCPSADKIKLWVKIHEENNKLRGLRENEEQIKESRKLRGSQWGRKTGENRIVRTESVDLALQQQAIKWKQRDMKWSGPRQFNEKKKIEEPVVEQQRNYWWQNKEEEEVKPDKKQELKEKFEREVLTLVESLDAHGHAARASAFISLRAALQRRAVDGLLAAHRATLADHVARALRRGKDGERKAAATVAPLLAVQIGEKDMVQFVREVRPALIDAATDNSASLDTRTECCSSLAVLCYLVKEDLNDILEIMGMYETIFSGGYIKDDGSLKVSGVAVEEGTWHAAALDGWALLLPLLSRKHMLQKHSRCFARLGDLLKAVSLEVRMAAGSALAIAYETVTDDDLSKNPLAQYVDVLLPRLTELARDTNKFRAKRDRKIQRATFRDILKYFEEGVAPTTSAHIATEPATWSTWHGGAAYAALSTALGGALQVLAPSCQRLRDVLQLSIGAPEKRAPMENSRKLQRHLQHKASSKARQFKRIENRDKRSDMLTI